MGDALLSERQQSASVQHLLDLFTNQMPQHTGTVTFSLDTVMLNISRRGNYQVLEVCFSVFDCWGFFFGGAGGRLLFFWNQIGKENRVDFSPTTGSL